MFLLAAANMDPDVINRAVCDWIANYSLLLLTGAACISRNNHAESYADKHHKKVAQTLLSCQLMLTQVLPFIFLHLQ